MENNQEANKNIEIKINEDNKISSGKNPTPRFNISLDRRWIKWILIVFIFLILVLLLRLTGINNILINVVLAFIPLLIAIAVCWTLNPVIRFLTKRGFNKTFAKYFTFFISLIIGLTILIALIFLLITQTNQLMNKALGDTETINNLIYSYFKKKSDRGDNSHINLLTNIYDFSYDKEARVFVINTNIEWDQLKSEWEKILEIISTVLSKNDNQTAWKKFLQRLILENNISIIGEHKFSVNYFKNLSNPSQFYDYFQTLYNSVSDFLLAIGPQDGIHDINQVNIGAIQKAFAGHQLSLQLGALYRLILQLSIKSRWWISATFLLEIIETIHDATNLSRLATLLVRDYFTIIVTILYSLFIAIMITMFILGEYHSVTHFMKTKLLPGKNQKQKDQLLKALQRSLFIYTKSLIINMTFMFFVTAFILWTIGFGFKSDIYFKAFIILAFFMAICNIVPYIGPVVGIIPIIIAGTIDATTSSTSSTYFINWLPLFLSVFSIFLIKIFERLVLTRFLLSKAIKVHPATILVAISLFAIVFGIFWVILALPVMVTVKAISYDVYDRKVPL